MVATVPPEVAAAAAAEQTTEALAEEYEEQLDMPAGTANTPPADQEEEELSPRALIEWQRQRIAELEDIQERLVEELEVAEERIEMLENTVKEQDEIIEENFRAAEASRDDAKNETCALKEIIDMQQAAMEQQEKLIQDSSEVIDQMSSCTSPASVAAKTLPASAPAAPPRAPCGDRPPAPHHRRATSERPDRLTPRQRYPMPPPPENAAPGGPPRERSQDVVGRGSARGPRPPPGPGPRVPVELRAAYGGAKAAAGALAPGREITPRSNSQQPTRLPRVLGS